MVTKIKPRRIKTDTPGSLGDFLGYQDEANFLWGEGGGRYIAGEGIAILDGLDYSAMRGPAPEGYHIPTDIECRDLVHMTRDMGAITLYHDTHISDVEGEKFQGYYKMPPAGQYVGGVSLLNIASNYWTCIGIDGGYYHGAAFIILNTNTTTPGYTAYNNSFERFRGLTLRVFKDIPVTPDNSWTTIFDGSSVATGAGIFHNPTLGLISASKDGINWVTIMDKNLGATTVWNIGDTLSESNCGCYYQWGNNYGHLDPSQATTSRAKVDTTGYGPGNYYSSDIWNISGQDWSDPHNNNLWGGETGVVAYNNKITNTGVLSVNGQTGDVTITGTTYTAGTGIDILNGPDYLAMQGPAPTGFHIPTQAEWKTMIDMFNLYGGYGPIMKEYFKMPYSGDREYSNSNISDSGTRGYYWTSTPTNATWISPANRAGALSFDNLTMDYYNGYYRGFGFPIRCFKDVSVAPDNTWTTLFDGSSIAAGAGIFHNSTLGLISASKDGINRITIMDKNLGATQVYNDGDVLSQANCGNYYQWGNNYGFSRTGSVTTSNTQVDASGYGPGNYYNSNIFITGNADWSSVQNDNLRGGATGVVTHNNEITNTGVLSVNGQTGDVIVDESNTKTFYLSGTSDLTTAQAAYDWYLAGKNPILNRFNQNFLFMGNQSGYMIFSLIGDIGDTYDFSTVNGGKVYLYYDSLDNVTNIIYTQTPLKVLKTDYDYPTPYTPQYDGSPATKKYVDDSILANTYTAGTGISIEYWDDYSAMRGPAQEGYHIPLKEEWQALIDAGTILGAWGIGGYNFNRVLKMPRMGYRRNDTSEKSDNGNGYYWSATPSNNNIGAYVLEIVGSGGLPYTYDESMGMPLRCFKDVSVAPDGNWTTIFDGSSVATGAGIFHNATLGLISISADGVNWITIKDKNEGATNVWEYGDTQSESNCGYYYQWGNNYGFAFTGTVQTGSTQVDASSYGPGNYYSNNVFFLPPSANIGWDSSANGNLWGGITGIIAHHNEVINTGVLSVNGQTGDVVVDEDVVPVYYYHGTFSNSITFSVSTPGDYKITINGYHGGNINRTVTINADGTDVASYTSTVIEMFSFMTVAHATTSLVISLSSDSLFTIHDVYVEKIAVQSGYLTAVVN